MMQQRSCVPQLRLDTDKQINVLKESEGMSKAVLEAKVRPKEMRPDKCPLDQGFGSSISQRWW